MDISIVDKDAIKIKSKLGSVVIDPTKNSKTTADAILLLTNDYLLTQIPADLKKESRVIISGAGEYEISGIKINGQSYGKELLYSLSFEGLEIIVGKANVFEKAHGKLKDCQVLVCNCDQLIHAQSLLSPSPRYIVLYGTQSKEAAKTLGKETAITATKFSTAIDKLPLEMEVILLG